MAMEMVLGASTTMRPCCFLYKSTPRPHIKPTTLSIPTSTAISLFTLFSPHSHEAKALTLPKDQLVSSITEVEKTLDQFQELGQGFFNSTRQAYDTLAEALEPSIEAAAPVLRQAGEEAAKLASPAFSEASRKAQEAIQGSGVDTEPVKSAAQIVADAAQQTASLIVKVKPIASSTVQSIASSDPVVLVGSAGALYLTYLLIPTIWSAISYNLRGYKGKLTAAQALDLISAKDHLMIDVRSEKDKNKAGIPRLPSSANNKMVAIPLEELPDKLKGLVRNVKKVEAEIVALKISYLKKITKGSRIVIMDSYSDSAKIVAKALTSLGFKNCWIVADGFSGRRGWLQSRLGADSYNVSFAEVLSPSRVIPAAVRRFGTTKSTTLSAQQLLPGSSD